MEEDLDTCYRSFDVISSPQSKPDLEAEFEYKVFYYIAEDDLITPFNHPPFKLRSLINAAYANDEDLSRICENSSSPNGESLSSELFTEDGHLRFDLILPLLLHPPPMPRGRLHWYKQILGCAQMALATYNRSKGTEYEVFAPVLCTSVFDSNYFLVHHVNFFAKLNPPDSPIELFFAEVVAVSVEPGRDKVIKCSILTTQNRAHYSRGCCTTDPLSILHPKEVDCPYCIQHLAFQDSD